MDQWEVHLTTDQQRELEWARRHHPKAYVRERAAAVLKVAAGQSARQVALHGLLRPHEPETIGTWIRRYQAGGLPGLLVQPGRGRKPAFFPLASGEPGRRD